MAVADGYTHLPGLLTVAEVGAFRHKILGNRTRFRWVDGFAMPDILGAAEYAFFREQCLLPWARLRARLDWISRHRYEIIDMCDIQINRTVGWHRDVLRPPLSRFQTQDLWTPRGTEVYQMHRLILYLEDHNSKGGLVVSPGTHLHRGSNRSAPHYRNGPFMGIRHVHTMAGDGVLFDMRLVHSGAHAHRYKDRVSIQVTTGVRNVFAQNWAKGDALRRHALMQRAVES